MKIRKLNEASEGFQKEFYKDYVILKNRAGDGWDIYSYEGTPEKVTRAVREEAGLATLKDAKATIDSWASKASLNEGGYKITIEQDGETFVDYCYDYREESAIAQMKAKYGDNIAIKNIEAHNKVNESRYQDISNVDLDNELVKDLVVRAFDYNQAQWLVDNDIEYAKHLAYDDVSEEEIAKAEQYLSSKGVAHQYESVESKLTLNEALFREDYSDDVITLSRYLDVEVPDICSGVLDLIEHLPSHKIVYITKICRDFYAKMESIIKNYTMTGDNFDESLKEHIMTDIPEGVSEEEHLKSLVGTKVEFRNKYMNRMSGHTGVITGIDNSGARLKANVHWEFDDINSPYDLEFLGSVPYLSDAKATESLKEDVTDVVTDTLSGPTEGPESGLSALLNEAVQDEFKTIQMYNDIAVSARAEGFEDIATVVDEINTEENKHVGQLQELLKTVSPNAKAIDTGEIEGQQQIGEVTDIVEEDLNNSNSSPNNNIEEDDKVMKESWEEVYQSFKTIEKELNGDGEAITATIDQLYRDNKGNPDYEKAYKKWASGE